MSRMLAALTAVLLGAAGSAAFADGNGPKAAGAAPVVLKVGDRVLVDGQAMGCRVARQNGSVVMDCRRAGALAGTYGTMLSPRKAMVVRYRNNSVAKVVFTATHRGGAHRCH
jgi:hypothetical protein